jgi:hypothetical protein
MIESIYCLRDKKVGYMAPMIEDNDPTAVRSLRHSIGLDKSLLTYTHPEDFTLYRLGSYDTSTGVITPCQPEIVIELSDIIGKE